MKTSCNAIGSKQMQKKGKWKSSYPTNSGYKSYRLLSDPSRSSYSNFSSPTQRLFELQLRLYSQEYTTDSKLKQPEYTSGISRPDLRISATMESSPITAVTREEFLQNLKPAAASTSEHDDKACHSCMEEMRFLPLKSDAGDTISCQAEDILSRAVILHDKHILCEGCAREWLASTNTCPECRKVLFEVTQEETSTEPTVYVDSINLREWSNNEQLHRLLQELGPSFLDQETRALAYFTRPLIRPLRERSDAYEEQNTFLDLEYPKYDALIRPGTMVGEEGDNQSCIITQRAVVNFWAWWAKRFFVTLGKFKQPGFVDIEQYADPDLTVNDDIDLRHHPLATSLLFQMLHALKTLPDAAPIKRPVLALFLSQRLTTFAKTRVGSAQAQDFDGYIGDMVEAALSASAGRMSIPASKPQKERESTYKALYETTSSFPES
ncbi:hypothetical protein HII31_05092 [Pseudocercospora fuligena]|uniref:RING-type domain-containing protein n=1 Tax=Pseudocercospora fuligena TaxID=685502 RepID=A0A8H6RM91_9PEZI|nr:hypothetical protein HII31_05092 [Pseudocercospora fuligena]